MWTDPVGFQSRARSLTEDFAYLSQVSLTDFFDMVLQLISSLAINYQYLFFVFTASIVRHGTSYSWLNYCTVILPSNLLTYSIIHRYATAFG